MRKVVYAISLTIDGCLDHTLGAPDEETGQYFMEVVRDAGLLVFGRKTYELMVPYWPDIAKSDTRTKWIKNLPRRLSLKRRLFSHDHCER